MIIENSIDIVEIVIFLSIIFSLVGFFLFITGLNLLLFSFKTQCKKAIRCIMVSIFLVLYYGFLSRFALFKLMTSRMPIYI